MLYILAVALIVPMAIAGMLWRGYVLSILWGWFAVPVFDAPPLDIPAAMGVSLIVGLAVMAGPPKSDGDSPVEKLSFSVGVMVFIPLVALFTGWIVKGYM